jgi:hypothetical protein
MPTSTTSRDPAATWSSAATTASAEVSFAYEKRIPLAGNVSLLIDFAGTTDPSGVVAAKAEAGRQVTSRKGRALASGSCRPNN